MARKSSMRKSGLNSLFRATQPARDEQEQKQGMDRDADQDSRETEDTRSGEVGSGVDPPAGEGESRAGGSTPEPTSPERVSSVSRLSWSASLSMPCFCSCSSRAGCVARKREFRPLFLMLDFLAIQHLSRQRTVRLRCIAAGSILQHRNPLYRCLCKLDGLPDDSVKNQLPETLPQQLHSLHAVPSPRIKHRR